MDNGRSWYFLCSSPWEHSLTLIEWDSCVCWMKFCFEIWQEGIKECTEAAAWAGEVSMTQGTLSLWRPPLTGPAGNMFKESSVCSHWVGMCKTPTECSREYAQRSKMALKSEAPSRKQVGTDFFLGNTETLYRNSGQLAVSRPSLHLFLKIHKKSSELLLLLFINSPTAHTIWILSSLNEQE